MARDNEVYIDTRLKVDELKKDIKFIENECKQLAKKIAPLMEMQDIGIQMKDSDVKALSEYTNQMAIYEEEIKSLKRQILELQHPTQKVEQAFANMTQTVSNSSAMEKYKAQLERLSNLKQEYLNNGRGENDFFVRLVDKDIERLKNKMSQLQTSKSDDIQKNDALKNSYKKLNQHLSTTHKGFGKVNKAVKNNSNAFKIGFKNILKYGLGVRSVFALVNKLRRALVDGFKNLAQFNDGINPVNESLSNLKSSFLLLKNSFATAFAPLLTSIEPIIVRISDAISNLVSKFGQLVASLTGASSFTRAVKTQEKYNSELKKTQSYLSGLDEIKTYDDGKTSGATSPNDMFETVAIDSKIAEIANKIKEQFAPIKEFFSTMFDNIDFSVLTDAWQRVVKIFEPFKGTFQSIALEIGKVVQKIVTDVIEWVDKFTKMLSGRSDKIQKIIAVLVTGAKVAIQFIGGLFKPFLNLVTNVFSHIIDIMSGVIDFIVNVFTGNWKDAWEAVKDIFKGIWNIIVDIFEGVINMIVGGLNNISIDIPDAIPVIGGKHIGFNLKEVNFPRLASGTVVPRQSKEFMAILGDNNKESEVVSPLSTIEQALENVLSRQSVGGGSYQFTAQINRRTLFNEVIEEAKMRQLQNGLNPFTAF